MPDSEKFIIIKNSINVSLSKTENNWFRLKLIDRLTLHLHEIPQVETKK